MNTATITRHPRYLPTIALTAILVIVFAGFGTIRNLSAQGQKSIFDGVYTEEQAKRGEKLFQGIGRCYECHLRNLSGDAQRNVVRPMVGAPFLGAWNGKSLNDLAYKIRWTMPTDIRGRGTLTVEQAADLIAYILQQNNVPAGSQEVSTEGSAALKQILIRQRPT